MLISSKNEHFWTFLKVGGRGVRQSPKVSIYHLHPYIWIRHPVLDFQTQITRKYSTAMCYMFGHTEALLLRKKRTLNGHFSRPAQTDPYTYYIIIVTINSNTFIFITYWWSRLRKEFTSPPNDILHHHNNENHTKEKSNKSIKNDILHHHNHKNPNKGKLSLR